MTLNVKISNLDLGQIAKPSPITQPNHPTGVMTFHPALWYASNSSTVEAQ